MIKIEGTILICDGTLDHQEDIIDASGVLFPVFMNRTPIGVCKVIQIEDRFVGTFYFSKYYTLPPEMQMLFPCVEGYVHKRRGSLVERYTITSIGLSTCNADPRILPLGKFNQPSLPWEQDTCKHEPVRMIFSSFCKKCNKML